MPTEQEEIEHAAEELMKAMNAFHGKLDAILERLTTLEKLVMEAEVEYLEDDKEEELPCSQPRDVDFWIDREARARSRQAQEAQQVPRAYPWNRKCEWTYK